MQKNYYTKLYKTYANSAAHVFLQFVVLSAIT